MDETTPTPPKPAWIETAAAVIQWAFTHLAFTATIAALIGVGYLWRKYRTQQADKGKAVRGLGAIMLDVLRFAVRDDRAPVITKPKALARRTTWLTGRRLNTFGIPLGWVGSRFDVPGAGTLIVVALLVLASRSRTQMRRRHQIVTQMFNVAAGECRYPKDAGVNPWAYIKVQSWQDSNTPGTTIVTYPAAYQSEDAKTREKFERQFNGTVSDKNAWTYKWESANNRVICQPSSFLPTMAPYEGPGAEWDKIPIGVAGDGSNAVWDVRTFPHALVCGPTGTGKSVLQRNILFHTLSHDQWRIVGIDPKRVEMAWLRDYDKVLRVATELEESVDVLRMLKAEMHRRYQDMEAEGVNLFLNLNNPPPAILLMIDETTILLAPEKIKSEEGKERDALHAEAGMIIGELGRLARAAGIHVIACMQRPDAEFLKGETKANFDCRIVAGRCDTTPSMMILDSEAATRLPLIRGRGMIRLGGDVQTFQGYYAEPDWYDQFLTQQEAATLPAGSPETPGDPGGAGDTRVGRAPRALARIKARATAPVVQHHPDASTTPARGVLAKIKAKAHTPPAGAARGYEEPREDENIVGRLEEETAAATRLEGQPEPAAPATVRPSPVREPAAAATPLDTSGLPPVPLNIAPPAPVDLPATRRPVDVAAAMAEAAAADPAAQAPAVPAPPAPPAPAPAPVGRRLPTAPLPRAPLPTAPLPQTVAAPQPAPAAPSRQPEQGDTLLPDLW